MLHKYVVEFRVSVLCIRSALCIFCVVRLSVQLCFCFIYFQSERTLFVVYALCALHFAILRLLSIAALLMGWLFLLRRHKLASRVNVGVYSSLIVFISNSRVDKSRLNCWSLGENGFVSQAKILMPKLDLTSSKGVCITTTLSSKGNYCLGAITYLFLGSIRGRLSAKPF